MNGTTEWDEPYQEWDDVGDDNNDTVLSMLHFEPADSVMASVYQELSWTS